MILQDQKSIRPPTGSIKFQLFLVLTYINAT